MFYQTQTTFRQLKGLKMSFWSPVTLTFKLVRVRDQTRLPCEFGANPFSSSRDYGAKNRTLRSSLHAVIATQ